MCMAWHGMLRKRVGSIHTSLVQNAVCMCCALCRSVKKVCVKWLARKLTYVKIKDGDTNKEAQVWSGSLVSLSFQPRSSLRRCLIFLLSHCRHSRSCSYHHYALQSSPPCAHTSASVVWVYMACECGHLQCICITWMGWTQSVSRPVGWCTCSYRPCQCWASLIIWRSLELFQHCVTLFCSLCLLCVELNHLWYR